MLAGMPSGEEFSRGSRCLAALNDRRQWYLAQRPTTVNEQTTPRPQRRGNAGQRLPTSLGMASIEGANAYREGKIEWLLAGQQHQLLRAGLAEAHPAGSYLRGRQLLRLRDRLGGPVHREDVACPEPCGDGARRGSRSAAYFEHPHPRADRQCVHDLGQARREAAHACHGMALADLDQPPGPSARRRDSDEAGTNKSRARALSTLFFAQRRL